MYKLLIFGNGGLWSVIRGNIDFNKAEIVAFINSDIEKRGKIFENSLVISPSEINDHEYDFIILASGQPDILMEQLLNLNISIDKIISFKMNESEFFRSMQSLVNRELAQNGNHGNFNLFSNHQIDTFRLCNMDLIGRQRRIELDDIKVDYVRLSSLDLIAEEIYTNEVSGNVAELGVYKGDFAKYINKAFPDRKLYLFDTFGGFDRRDVEFDISSNYSIETTQFRDTNVDLVLTKMKHPENIILKKGYFPETTVDLEDQFAFVSIDADLYKPIYDALNYFYPRLSKGGYIFVHDYNNSIYKGAKQAVKRYCSENGVAFVPISDNLGTAILSK